jgi:AcrR family transcriptional regulator
MPAPVKTRPRRPPGRPPTSVIDHAGGREQILDAAAQVFAREGYRGATIDAILHEAGFSKGTFYWHFRSKDELVATLLAERVERPIRALIERLRSAPADANMSAEASRHFAEFLDRERAAVLLDHEYEGLAARDPALRRRYVRQRRALRQALGEALAERARQLGATGFTTPAEEVATAYLALVRGLSRERLLDPGAVPDHMLGEISGLIYIGLLARAYGSDWQRYAVIN